MKIFIGLILLSSVAHADTMVSCNDGDTCRIKRATGVVKVRLSGIDAPESDQTFGPQARAFLIELIKGQQLQLKCDGQSYDRITCGIYIGNRDIQSELVRAGWALDSPKYSHRKYAKEQSYASKNHLGMWTSKDLTSPYCWRWTGTRECNKNKLYQE
jgi:micrococcal nuclease